MNQYSNKNFHHQLRSLVLAEFHSDSLDRLSFSLMRRPFLRIDKRKYRIYSINRPGRLLNFWTLRVGAYSRLGAY